MIFIVRTLSLRLRFLHKKSAYRNARHLGVGFPIATGQWQIQIFSGGTNLRERVPTYYLANFLLQSA